MLQTLFRIVGILAIAGLLLWALSQFNLDPTIAKFIRVIVIVVVGVWLILTLLGLAAVRLY